MSGYAVTAHIRRAEVRAAAPRAPDATDLPVPIEDAIGPEMRFGSLAGRPVDDPGPVERWIDDLRTGWAQTTFFLFDPQSWR